MVFLYLGCCVVDLEIYFLDGLCILDGYYVFWMVSLCILFGLMKDIMILSLFWLISLLCLIKESCDNLSDFQVHCFYSKLSCKTHVIEVSFSVTNMSFKSSLV